MVCERRPGMKEEKPSCEKNPLLMDKTSMEMMLKLATIAMDSEARSRSAVALLATIAMNNGEEVGEGFRLIVKKDVKDAYSERIKLGDMRLEMDEDPLSGDSVVNIIPFKKGDKTK